MSMIQHFWCLRPECVWICFSRSQDESTKSHAAAETLVALALYPCLCLKTATFANKKNQLRLSLKILCSHTSHSQWICLNLYELMNLYFHLFWYIQPARKEKHGRPIAEPIQLQDIQGGPSQSPSLDRPLASAASPEQRPRGSKRCHKCLRITRRCRAQGVFFSGSPSVLCCHSALARNLLVAPRPPRYVGHSFAKTKTESESFHSGPSE